MRLYLAGVDDGNYDVLAGLEHLAILVSYWLIQEGQCRDIIDRAARDKVPLFLDSGAYSAMSVNASISNQEYIDYCLVNGSRFEAIASLDVIGDGAATARNHAEMQEAGIDAIPTFHALENFSHLKALAEHNPYIALGGLAKFGQKREYQKPIMSWIAKAFQVARAINPAIKIHGFGVTSWKRMAQFEWTSVDSTTWFVAQQYGELLVRDGRRLTRIAKSRPRDLERYGIGVAHLLPDRNQATEQYHFAKRHNAKVLLEWVAEVKNA